MNLRIVYPSRVPSLLVKIKTKIFFRKTQYSLFFTFHSKYGQYKKTYPIIGVFMLLSTILIIIGVLIFTNILVPTSKANDSIMLLTLLISLPSELYIQLIGQYVKK